VQVLRGEIDRHSTDMKHVDHTGTYLKYFGSKQDTIYVRNRLSSTRLRWKRLLRRTDETSRRLERALRDAKRVNICPLYVEYRIGDLGLVTIFSQYAIFICNQAN